MHANAKINVLNKIRHPIANQHSAGKNKTGDFMQIENRKPEMSKACVTSRLQLLT